MANESESQVDVTGREFLAKVQEQLDAKANPQQSVAQPEAAAAMTGHQVWTSIHTHSSKAAEPEAAAAAGTEAAAPDDKGPDVYVHISTLG